MLLFYSLALVLVLIVGAPYWLFRMATSGKYRVAASTASIAHRPDPRPGWLPPSWPVDNKYN